MHSTLCFQFGQHFCTRQIAIMGDTLQKRHIISRQLTLNGTVDNCLEIRFRRLPIEWPIFIGQIDRIAGSIGHLIQAALNFLAIGCFDFFDQRKIEADDDTLLSGMRIRYSVFEWAKFERVPLPTCPNRPCVSGQFPKWRPTPRLLGHRPHRLSLPTNRSTLIPFPSW